MWVFSLIAGLARAPRFWFAPEVFIMVYAGGGPMPVAELLFASLPQSEEEVVRP